MTKYNDLKLAQAMNQESKCCKKCHCTEKCALKGQDNCCHNGACPCHQSKCCKVCFSPHYEGQVLKECANFRCLCHSVKEEEKKAKYIGTNKSGHEFYQHPPLKNSWETEFDSMFVDDNTRTPEYWNSFTDHHVIDIKRFIIKALATQEKEIREEIKRKKHSIFCYSEGCCLKEKLTNQIVDDILSSLTSNTNDK